MQQDIDKICCNRVLHIFIYIEMIIFCLLLLASLLPQTAQYREALSKSQYPFGLIDLPYSADALEPVISDKTIELHHGKHLKGYIDKLNALIANTPYTQMSLGEIIVAADSSIYDTAIFNNAGQLLNHNLYFTQFTSPNNNRPQGMLADAIYEEWGSFENFKSEFNKNGAELFGSGWVWLAADYEGKLYIVQEPNGGNPITKGLIPLMGIDVWEHAYYLDYQNRRSDHLNAIWDIIDWSTVEQRYESAGFTENNCSNAIKELDAKKSF